MTAHTQSKGIIFLCFLFMTIVVLAIAITYTNSTDSIAQWNNNIIQSNPSKIRECIKNDKDINLDSPINIEHDERGLFADNSLVPPIVFLSSRGYYDSLELLLDHGADPNKRGPKMRTALYWAVRLCDVQSVDLLVSYNADINLADDNGITALMVAVREGCDVITHRLLNLGVNVNAQTTSYGETALHIAAGFSRVDAMKQLLDHGSDINIESITGNTALMNATSQSCVDCMELLIKNGANPNAISENGNMNTTPLLWAAATSKDTIGMKLLLSYDVNINYKNANGQTALHNAAEYGIPDMIRFLLLNGADPQSTDIHGDTPLDKAVNRDDGNNKSEIVSILREYSGH